MGGAGGESLKAVTRVESDLPLFVKGTFPAKTAAMPLVHRTPVDGQPTPARPQGPSAAVPSKPFDVASFTNRKHG